MLSNNTFYGGFHGCNGFIIQACLLSSLTILPDLEPKESIYVCCILVSLVLLSSSRIFFLKALFRNRNPLKLMNIVLSALILFCLTLKLRSQDEKAINPELSDQH